MPSHRRWELELRRCSRAMVFVPLPVYPLLTQADTHVPRTRPTGVRRLLGLDIVRGVVVFLMAKASGEH